MNRTKEEKKCYFHIANKFHNLKANVINEAVHKLECSYNEIEENLQMCSETPSSAKKNS